jgi:hypothetical protein
MAQLNAIQDLLLTDVSIGVFSDQFELVGEKIFPVIKSKMTTGKLGKYGKQHLRIESTLKAGRGEYRRVESITRSTTSYSIEGHGLESLVTPDDYRNVQQPFDAEKDETVGVTTQILLEKELVVAQALTNTAVLTQNTTLSGSSQFSDYANSDPLAIAATAREAVREGCGLKPDTVIFDYQVYNKLRFHPQLLDALGYKWDRPGGLNAQELCAALDVKKILLPDGVYNNSVEGQADALTPIWGKDMLFAVLPPTAQPRQVSLGYYVTYDQQPRAVYKQPEFNPPGSTKILVEDSYQYLVSDVGAGYLVKGAVA